MLQETKDNLAKLPDIMQKMQKCIDIYNIAKHITIRPKREIQTIHQFYSNSYALDLAQDPDLCDIDFGVDGDLGFSSD